MTSSIVPDFDQNVFKKFHDNQRKVNILDLQKEIQIIKKEIKDLKIIYVQVILVIENQEFCCCKKNKNKKKFIMND